MGLETKQNEEARSSPQISGVMVLYHNMVSPQIVSPQNGVTRSGPPPVATPLVAVGTESNGLNRIFANKGNVGKVWGTSLLPQVALISPTKPISSSISLRLRHMNDVIILCYACGDFAFS